jgi:hypothetical protein
MGFAADFQLRQIIRRAGRENNAAWLQRVAPSSVSQQRQNNIAQITPSLNAGGGAISAARKTKFHDRFTDVSCFDFYDYWAGYECFAVSV